MPTRRPTPESAPATPRDGRTIQQRITEVVAQYITGIATTPVNRRDLEHYVVSRVRGRVTQTHLDQMWADLQNEVYADYANQVLVATVLAQTEGHVGVVAELRPSEIEDFDFYLSEAVGFIEKLERYGVVVIPPDEIVSVFRSINEEFRGRNGRFARDLGELVAHPDMRVSSERAAAEDAWNGEEPYEGGPLEDEEAFRPEWVQSGTITGRVAAVPAGEIPLTASSPTTLGVDLAATIEPLPATGSSVAAEVRDMLTNRINDGYRRSAQIAPDLNTTLSDLYTHYGDAVRSGSEPMIVTAQNNREPPSHRYEYRVSYDHETDPPTVTSEMVPVSPAYDPNGNQAFTHHPTTSGEPDATR